MTTNTFLKVLLYLWFYVGWFVCIFLAQRDLSSWSLLLAAVSWGLSLRLYPQGVRGIVFFLFLLGLGLGFDTFAVNYELLVLTTSSQFGLPLWLVSIWLLFLSVLPMMRSFFERRLMLAGLLGAIFGPLSYLSGQKFSLVTLVGWSGTLAYVLFWALFFPLAIWGQGLFLKDFRSKVPG